MTSYTHRFAVAPMMDWTDRHCRYFHRQLTKSALLYTEMVVADALIYGDVPRHLDFDSCEHPIALQLGGSDPEKLAKAAKIGADWGYDEINLNVGCPSDRVQSGTFGACLMRQPQLVADCVKAIKDVVSIPVTVKCRIGVDDQDTQIALDDLYDKTQEAGCDAYWVHARKAWLQGLSPKENRDIPPLDYGRVIDLKNANPGAFVGINGGISDLDMTIDLLGLVDGVMIGRAAYQDPQTLSRLDEVVYGADPRDVDFYILAQSMMRYGQAHLQSGGRVHHVTRHMIGLFQGYPGARRYRQILSVEATRPQVDERVIEQAFAAVLDRDEAAA